MAVCCLALLAGQTLAQRSAGAGAGALLRARPAAQAWSFSEIRSSAPASQSDNSPRRAAHSSAPSRLASRPQARIRRLLNRSARRYRVNPKLVRAVARQESDFLPRVVSSKGAMGVMQLMPQTARELRVRRPFDAADNIDGGVRFLRDLLLRYHGNRRLALAAYNAGPGAVDRFGGIPPYSETQHYVRAILKHLGPQPSTPAARRAARRSPLLRKTAAPRPIWQSRDRRGAWVFSNTG